MLIPTVLAKDFQSSIATMPEFHYRLSARQSRIFADTATKIARIARETAISAFEFDGVSRDHVAATSIGISEKSMRYARLATGVKGKALYVSNLGILAHFRLAFSQFHVLRVGDKHLVTSSRELMDFLADPACGVAGV